VGGAGSIDACQRFVLASSVLPAWGEPARPSLPPEGETGKGALNSLLPQADLLREAINSPLLGQKAFEFVPDDRFSMLRCLLRGTDPSIDFDPAPV
jgi:hypothetical protein